MKSRLRLILAGLVATWKQTATCFSEGNDERGTGDSKEKCYVLVAEFLVHIRGDWGKQEEAEACRGQRVIKWARNSPHARSGFRCGSAGGAATIASWNDHRVLSAGFAARVKNASLRNGGEKICSQGECSTAQWRIGGQAARGLALSEGRGTEEERLHWVHKGVRGKRREKVGRGKGKEKEEELDVWMAALGRVKETVAQCERLQTEMRARAKGHCERRTLTRGTAGVWALGLSAKAWDLIKGVAMAAREELQQIRVGRLSGEQERRRRRAWPVAYQEGRGYRRLKAYLLGRWARRRGG